MNLNAATVYNNLGVLLTKDENRRDEAETAYNTAIKTIPNAANAYFKLSAFKALYGSKEDKDEIFEWLKKIVDLNPSLKESVKLFAEIDWIRDDKKFAKIVGRDDE